MAPRFTVSILISLLPGCILDFGRCTYEHRSLELSAVLAERSAPPVFGPHTAVISLNETRDARPDFRVIAVSIQTPLYIETVRAELVDVSGGDTTVLAQWNPGSTSQPGNWYATLDLAGPSPAHERLVWLARHGQLALVVALIGENRTMAGTLAVSGDGDWERPHCS